MTHWEIQLRQVHHNNSLNSVKPTRTLGCKKQAVGLLQEIKYGLFYFTCVFYTFLCLSNYYVTLSHGQGFGIRYPSFSIPMSLPTPGSFMLYHPAQQHFYPPPHGEPPGRTIQMSVSSPYRFMSGIRPKQISLPSMKRVSETIGALGTLARRFLTSSSPQAIDEPQSKSEEQNILSTAASQVVSHSASPPVEFKVKPEDDPELNHALYTLSRNVLGQNVTESLVPIVKGVNSMGRFLPPLIYRDGRIILGTGNATNNGGSIKDAVCTTPGGNTGKCLDISGCPSLLLDLQKLRKSLCFKALFVPGVCCPDKPESESEVTSTRRPSDAATTSPSVVVTNRPFQVVTKATTKRPGFVMPDDTLNDLSRCGRPENPSFRIVGGEKSTPGNWPWMAAIFLHGPKGTEFWCGGSLISKKYILTAAHCTKDQKQKSFSARQFTVRLGDYDLAKTDDPSSPETYRVVSIKAHPDFNGVGFYNDVALLELDREVDYNRFISPICLPTARNKINSFVGTYPTVIGWGTNKYGGREHTALQEVKLPVWTNSDCDRAYFQPITHIFLCAGYPSGGRDACQGDSGGPLMLELEGKWMQIGIVSFGNRCAEPGYPGVYTRLTEFMDWIQTNAV